MRDIVVYDTNILIDLFDMGILGMIPSLNVAIHTTSLVWQEITDTQQKEQIASSINLNIYQYDTIEQYVELNAFKDGFEAVSNLSMIDFSVMFLAEKLNAPLYTTDKRLKKIAVQHGLTTYGSLYIVIDLCRNGIITKLKAIEVIQDLKNKNSRLSLSVIEEALNELDKLKI